jgi:AraC-like DNA-binding protein
MAVLRFQRFLALGAREPQEPLGRLAVDAGYADHAHLVRDCRRLAGTTPGRLMAARAGAAGEPALRAA